MACSVVPGLIVRVQTCESETCNPKPSMAGLMDGDTVEVFGISDYSETSEAYFIVCNKNGEFWFLPTRHFRFVRLK